MTPSAHETTGKERTTISEENLCFADFEFTCGFYIDKAQCELLSIGLVICDGEYNVLKTYYRTAKPNIHSKLTKQCRKLTKLTQEEINASADADEAAGEVCSLLKQFGISQVSVWGNFDRPGSPTSNSTRGQEKAPRTSAACSLWSGISRTRLSGR